MQSPIQPWVVMWLRLVSGSVFFFLLIPFVQKKFYIEKADFVRLALCTLFGCIINQVCFYYGMKLTTPINASIFNLINPITIIVLSYFLLNIRITKITFLGFCLALLGCTLLLDFKNIHLSDSTFWGDMLILLNAISFGAYIVVVAPLSKKYHPFVISAGMLGLGAMVLTPMSFNDILLTKWHAVTSSEWLALGFIILGNTIAAFYLTNLLPSITSPHIMGVYVYAQPFFAAGIAMLLGLDSLKWEKVLSGGLIITGIAVAQYGKKH